MKTLYLSDLDGTLLNDEGFLSDYTADTLNRLLACGLNFTVATARSAITASPILKRLSLALPAALTNGVMLADPITGNPADVSWLPAKAASKVFMTFERFGRTPMAYLLKGTDISLRYQSSDNPAEQRFVAERRTRYKHVFEVERQGPASNLMFINIIDRYEALAPIYEAICKIKGVRAEFYPNSYDDTYFLEIFNAESGKANALYRLKTLYGFDRVVAFGDNNNDIEMLKAADLAVVVGNAADHVKAVADVVIDSNQEDGVARFIEADFEKE